MKAGITGGGRGNLEIALPGGDACVLNLQQDPAVGRDRKRFVGGRQRREVGLPGFHTSAPGAVVRIGPYSLLSKVQTSFEAPTLHSVILHGSRMKTVPHSSDCCVSRRAHCYWRLWAVQGMQTPARGRHSRCPGGQSVCRLTCVTLGQG